MIKAIILISLASTAKEVLLKPLSETIIEERR
jgi:hypothetical protein